MASTCTGLRRVPPCAPPPELIAAMVDAGAHMEEVEGGEEGDDRPLCVLRIDKVESKAWKLYQDWTELLGDVDPLVQAVFAPSTALVGTPLCPPLTLVGGILNEANSIINQLAPLSTEDSGKGEDVLTGPLQAPVMMVNVDRASVSTTVVLPVIANPGDKYPVIHAMPYGQYICTIQYVWTGVFISVGMYRSNATVLA
ncbi:hypothetical protein Poli38472_007050 [Pythium oligandrum]|uniref:Uncharacterized protein n=1 Tax=Pythium oligandrum TaxID=41045 RepID=A0A8K1FD00_PYTOL|nr:hypothetical protein Poli38472_007050 [Pythium oligandrum]|eukprot:TMW58905.1 hypothetical protein Poli38472_007050 [Pythium oligandrum]